jgi:ADP-dependent NAD(P)H-hydrate dehydratase
MIKRVSALPSIPARPEDAHKGMYGKILLIAGSRGMSGAAVLAGNAALRGGAGLVRIATPASVAPIISIANPCYMTAWLPEDSLGRITMDALPLLKEGMDWATVVAVGPGLGQGEAVGRILESIVPVQLPLVLDADALNSLTPSLPLLSQRVSPAILTPHPGEFSRLTGLTIREIEGNREGHAIAFARKYGVVLVLKGAGTIITDGERIFVNTTGNPGMATGGCGDVLTGLIASLLGQGLAPFKAAQLGAYLHGKAGDIVWEERSYTPLIATDLIDRLPEALAEVENGG